jgi:hypothetical protein
MQIFRVIGLFLVPAILAAWLAVPAANAQQPSGSGASIEASIGLTPVASKAKQSKPKKRVALGKCYHEPICQICCYDQFGQPKGCRFDTIWCGK